MRADIFDPSPSERTHASAATCARMLGGRSGAGSAGTVGDRRTEDALVGEERIMNISGFRCMSTLAALIAISSYTALAGQRAVQAPVDVEALFTSSGWMGDGEYGRKY